MSKDTTTPTSKEIGRHLEANDKASQQLGIVLEEIREGYAKCTMTLREDMVNGHGFAHGGTTYHLADTAFAYACNANAEGLMTVNQSSQIQYLRPVQVGDHLTAVCKEVHHPGRVGIYDCVITNQNNEDVLLFRATAYRTSESIL